MQFKVHEFCKLAKFAKFSLCEMFSLKRYKVDFNNIAELSFTRFSRCTVDRSFPILYEMAL